LPRQVRVYRVGGSVRDELAGLPAGDRDWVVVGATPEIMLASGYKPVGRDFPVFLHPETREEYALARTERKDGRGHRGFRFFAAPDVTLEEDLARRDLTINAMARDEHGALVDPYDGAADLARGVLRHVSDAFAEDPLRVLRVARFASRFGFAVAPATEGLMRAIVASGELRDLAPERLWQEISRGLMERTPSRMLAVLRDCGALAALLPEIDALYAAARPAAVDRTLVAGVHVALALDLAAARELELPVRYAVLVQDVGLGAGAGAAVARAARIAQRLRVPAECRDAGALAARWHAGLASVRSWPPARLLELLQAADAFRRPARLDALCAAARAARDACSGREDDDDAPGRWITEARAVVRGVDAGAIARAAAPAEVERAVRSARLSALRAWKRRAVRAP